MVRRGRAGRGRTVGLSWVTREDNFAFSGAEDAAEAMEGPKSPAWEVGHWDAGLDSLSLLLDDRVLDTGADIDKHEPGDAEASDVDFWEGAVEFRPTVVTGNSIGVPNFSC